MGRQSNVHATKKSGSKKRKQEDVLADGEVCNVTRMTLTSFFSLFFLNRRLTFFLYIINCTLAAPCEIWRLE